jgi:hypothetical protein
MVALDLDHRGGHGQELGQELVGKALARKGDVGVLEMSVIRPTRSWCLTSQYLSLTFCRSVSFDAAILSRITLNTYGIGRAA